MKTGLSPLYDIEFFVFLEFCVFLELDFIIIILLHDDSILI